MEEQMNQPMLMPECFSIPGKSKMSMISNALLLVLPFWFLILGADLTFVGVMVKMLTTIELLMNQDFSGSEVNKLVHVIIENVWFFLGVQIFLKALYSIVSVVCLLVNHVNLKNVFHKIGGRWRIRRIVSWLRLTVSVIVVNVIVLISVGLLSALVVDVALILSSLMVVVVATLCCLYLGMVWMFSMVMSITEMHTSEIVVFENSDKLIEGRTLQGFVLMMFPSILSIATIIAFAFNTTKEGRGLDAQFAQGIMVICYVCLLKIFMFVLYRVYRYESNMENGEQVDVEDGSGYSPIVTSVV